MQFLDRKLEECSFPHAGPRRTLTRMIRYAQEKSTQTPELTDSASQGRFFSRKSVAKDWTENLPYYIKQLKVFLSKIISQIYKLNFQMVH